MGLSSPGALMMTTHRDANETWDGSELHDEASRWNIEAKPSELFPVYVRHRER